MISYSVLLDERLSLRGEPTEFRLFGFPPEVVARVGQDLHEIVIHDEAPQAAELRDVVLSPMRARSENTFWGGVFGADGKVRAEAEVRRHEEGAVFGLSDEAYPQEAPTHRLERAWYGGVLFNCYGHVILESLARITAEMVASDLPIVFHVGRERPGSLGVFKQMLAYLGIEETRLRFVDEVLAVDVLLTPPMGIILGERLNLAHVRFLQGVVDRNRGRGAALSDRPVLLSRSALKAQTRKAFGELHLEERLAAHVDIVHPQELSFAEQVEVINGSARHLGFVGSQMHNLLFSAHGGPLDVLYFSARRIPRTYLQIDLAFGGARSYVHAATYGAAFEFGRGAPFIVNFAVAGDGLRVGGFVPQDHQMPPPADEEHALLEDYYRTWAERLFRFKFVRPSQYWPADDAEEQLQKTIAVFKPKLAALLEDPETSRILREVAEESFGKRRLISADLARRFIDGLFAPEAV